MRILHFADLHIGVENYGKPDPETGLSTRLKDFLAAYDRVVQYALDTRVDLVLFCGDAYKSRDPSQTHQREFARRIARLSSEGIPVFLLVGNHDLPHVLGRATALEIFQTLDVANVHIGDALKTYVIETASGPLQVIAVPWVTRSSFLAKEETRRLTPDQVNEAIQERLARLIRAQAESLNPDLPAVLAGHLSVGDAKAGSEQWMTLGRDYVLLKSDVALPQVDYVALGHVHRHQILATDPYVVYSGSIERVDFGEEDDEKGFCMVDLDAQRPAGSRVRDFEVSDDGGAAVPHHRGQHPGRRARSNGGRAAGGIQARRSRRHRQIAHLVARRARGSAPRQRDKVRVGGGTLRIVDIEGGYRPAEDETGAMVPPAAWIPGRCSSSTWIPKGFPRTGPRC